jgi:D-arabinose 5-phosphate isomerase GutQ
VKQNERLQRQVTHLKEREVTLTAETKGLRDDLAKKASLLIKMKEDKEPIL